MWSLQHHMKARTVRGSSAPVPSLPAAPHVPILPLMKRETSTARPPNMQQPHASQQGGGLGDEEGMDVAVFRFTLGIPGFEDRLIPRVVGAAGGLLLVVNHFLGALPASDAQVRAEVLCGVLAAVCAIVPEIEERLKEALPGRGRQGTAGAVDGATQGFFLAPGLADATKQELAWASFSLIKNTNTCGVVVVSDGKVVMARGQLGEGGVVGKDAEKSLAAMAKGLPEFAAACSKEMAVEGASRQQLYLPERSAFGRVQAGSLTVVPRGAASLLVQTIETASKKPATLLMFSERPRALSDRERSWGAAVALKLGQVLG